MTVRMIWNFEILKRFCDENSVEVMKDYTLSNITANFLIEGKCKGGKCNENFSKRLMSLIHNGALCKSCSLKSAVEKREKTYFDTHGYKNPSQNPKIKTIKKETCLKNFGVENPMYSEEIKKKLKETCIEIYGVTYPVQHKDVIEKNRQTCLRNYGVEYASQCKKIREKQVQTCLKNHGVENPSQCPKIQEKKIQTSLERYGVEFPTQDPIISEKMSQNAYKAKDYVLPSGNVIRLQGYERFGIKELLEIENIKEEDIITKRTEVPKIVFKDADGKEHRYFVDFYIPSQKRCIEVKSTWTMHKKRDYVLEKQKATKDHGYKCEIWIYDHKGVKLETI